MDYTPQSRNTLTFPEKIMLIGELSKRTGLSKDTIRFYKKLGLIVSKDRPAGTRQYQEFSVEMVERLLLIKQGKQLGFSLNEMKQFLDRWGSDTIPKIEQIQIVEKKLEEINEKMQQIEKIKTYLTAKLSRLKQEANSSNRSIDNLSKK